MPFIFNPMQRAANRRSLVYQDFSPLFVSLTLNFLKCIMCCRFLGNPIDQPRHSTGCEPHNFHPQTATRRDFRAYTLQLHVGMVLAALSINMRQPFSVRDTLKFKAFVVRTAKIKKENGYENAKQTKFL